MVCKLWVKFQALCVVEARYAGLLSWPQENWLYIRNTVFHSLFSCRKLSAWLFRSGCSSFRLALIKVENRRQDTIRIRVGYEGIMSSRLFVDTLLRHLIWQKLWVQNLSLQRSSIPAYCVRVSICVRFNASTYLDHLWICCILIGQSWTQVILSMLSCLWSSLSVQPLELQHSLIWL